MFISFEGPEGSGKSTQLDLLAQYLHSLGKQVLCLREPGGTQLGEQVRQILLAPSDEPMSARAELLLFCASRAQLMEQKIRPALKQGHWVLVDRFVDSTAVYQGMARGLSVEVTKLAAQLCIEECMPELTLLFDASLELSLQRMQSRGDAPDRIELESAQFHQQVRDGYLSLAKQEPDRIKVLDAAKSVEDLAKEVIKLIPLEAI